MCRPVSIKAICLVTRLRLLTSWWRKVSNMTVGQSSPISSIHRCYDWHSGNICGWTCNQLISKVDEGKSAQDS